MKNRPPSLACSLFVPLAVVVTFAAVGCAKVTTAGGTGASSGTGGNGVIIGGTGGAFVGTCSPCTDFPPNPIMDPDITGNPGSMFNGTPPASGGPCITEPEDGTLFPNNWLRPRVKFSNTGKLAQIRMTAANQTNELVAYTTKDFWVMDPGIWAGLRGHQVGFPNKVEVTVWIQGAGATKTHFNTAPVGANGNMIFWAADPTVVGVMPAQCQAMPALCNNAAELRAFQVGSETTQSVLQIGQVTQPSRLDSGAPTKVTCIGCHSGTPDSGFVVFVDNYPWRAASASVQMGGSGTPWTTTMAGLNALLQPGWGPFTFTKGNSNVFWQAGKRILVGALGLKEVNVPDHSNGPDQNDSPHLAWINLEGSAVRAPVPGDQGNWDYTTFAPGMGVDSNNALGFIAHDGDPNGAATPNWSHDGTTIAYASTNAALSGRLNMEAGTAGPNPGDPTHNATMANFNGARAPGLTNIFTVPFNNGLGGTAMPVQGAANPDREEYYPAFSPDDKLLAFTFVPAGQVMYANPQAQIAVVPKGGGMATVLAANNPTTSPPNCTAKSSPGVNNHWPKWSPQVQPGPDGIYYWLIFSSNRTGATATSNYDHQVHIISQLYVAPVVVGENGMITPYPAIYLWNQPADHVNTTPAWESFALPPIP